jgi:hypothetical protein
MTPEVMSDRLMDFAARAGKVVDALPNTRLGRHVAGQLVRCGTAPGPNYEEGCGAESATTLSTNSVSASRNSANPDIGSGSLFEPACFRKEKWASGRREHTVMQHDRSIDRDGHKKSVQAEVKSYRATVILQFAIRNLQFAIPGYNSALPHSTLHPTSP